MIDWTGSDALEVIICFVLKVVEDAAGRSVIGSSTCLRSLVRIGISYDPYAFRLFVEPDSGMRTTMTFISSFFANSINLSWTAIKSLSAVPYINSSASSHSQTRYCLTSSRLKSKNRAFVFPSQHFVLIGSMAYSK